MRNKIFSLLIPILVLFCVNITAAGAYTLTVDDGGKDSFPRIYAVSADGSETFLLDSDPLSSGWTFNINEAAVSPADNGWLRSSRTNESGFILVYTDRSYRFEQRATVSDSGNYILISASFTNNSGESIRITPLLLLDTILGEDTGLPFHLPDGSYISGETVLSGSSMPEWIKSKRSVEYPSLALIFENQFATTPESIAMANWLRLKQQGASFSPESGRDFNYLPFSENDSAVLLSYRERRLSPGAELGIKLIVGLNTRAPGREAFAIRAPADLDSSIEDKRLREYTLRRRIEEIQSVLDSLDYLLDNSESITSEAVLEIERITATQEKLRAEYENL